MKTLFINVPQWYPMSPYSSSVILIGQFKKSGFDAVSRDLNIEFFNRILTRANVLDSARRAEELIPYLEAVERAFPGTASDPDSVPPDELVKLCRLDAIRKFFDKESELVGRTADAVEGAVQTLKDPVEFYDPEKHFIAKDVINDALRIVSLPYAPNRIMIDNYISDAVLGFSYSNVKKQCFDAEGNMFIEFYKSVLPQITDGYDLIGISMSDLSQLIPALTLGRMIKEKSSVTVNIGGNYVYKIINEIKNFPEFFGLFCDSVTAGDGETAAVELAEYVDGRRAQEDVHSLVWADKDGTVRTNETAPLLDLDSLAFPDFDSCDFSAYFSPEPVLPVQLGKGCYWGRCKFCDFYTGQQKFDIKSVSHAADEVEYLVKRYSVHNFIFVDEAVPPEYYDRFALELIRRGTDIHFYSFARFDRGFTREVLQHLYDAGAKFFSWGYETASARLLGLMNKGIDPDVRQRILRDCVDIGIWTQCTFLLGYPTETPDELRATMDVIEDRDLINSCTPSNFVLKKNAILRDEAEDVGLSHVRSNGDFHISYSYDSDGSSMDEVKKHRMDFQKRFLDATADCLWSLGFTDTDHLLLYLSRYGRDWVRDYRLHYRKKNL